MKVLVATLALVFAAHCQCLASCSAMDFGMAMPHDAAQRTEAPLCHEGENEGPAPDSSHHLPQHDETSCGLGSVVEAKAVANTDMGLTVHAIVMDIPVFTALLHSNVRLVAAFSPPDDHAVTSRLHLKLRI